jgi:hypothetical protein
MLFAARTVLFFPAGGMSVPLVLLQFLVAVEALIADVAHLLVGIHVEASLLMKYSLDSQQRQTTGFLPWITRTSTATIASTSRM